MKRRCISALSILFLASPLYSESTNNEATFSLSGDPEHAITVGPLAIIPLRGGTPYSIHPGAAGQVLAFKTWPEPVKDPKPSDESGSQSPIRLSGAAVLTLKNAKLTILPDTQDTDSASYMETGQGKLQVTANAHSIYVSNGATGTVKRFNINDFKLVAERTFEKESQSGMMKVLTSSSATNTPLILVHPTQTQFLSADRLLPVAPRYGPQAIGSSPPLNNASGYIASPEGSVFFRGGQFWEYRNLELVSRNNPSIGTLDGRWLSYNGALIATQEGLAATSGKASAAHYPFTSAITRPLSYKSSMQVSGYRLLGNQLTVYRNQATTPILDITLPDLVYKHHFISFAANRLVAISDQPPQIFIYELDLEKILEKMTAPPWVEVTGPGYMTVGSQAVFQMRPVFGKFKSLKLIQPLKNASIKGTQIILTSRRDDTEGPQRVVIEYRDKEGRIGITFFDVNVLKDIP